MDMYTNKTSFVFGFHGLDEEIGRKIVSGIEEIRQYHKKSNLPLKRFFNTSGLIYRELGLKDKLNNMTEEELITLLSTDGMLVKRPVFITDTNVFLGFKEIEWKETLINI